MGDMVRVWVVACGCEYPVFVMVIGEVWKEIGGLDDLVRAPVVQLDSILCELILIKGFTARHPIHIFGECIKKFT